MNRRRFASCSKMGFTARAAATAAVGAAVSVSGERAAEGAAALSRALAANRLTKVFTCWLVHPSARSFSRAFRVFVWASSSCFGRSEEHTSELQSRENLVCRLLIEIKKKTITCFYFVKTYLVISLC